MIISFVHKLSSFYSRELGSKWRFNPNISNFSFLMKALEEDEKCKHWRISTKVLQKEKYIHTEIIEVREVKHIFLRFLWFSFRVEVKDYEVVSFSNSSFLLILIKNGIRLVLILRNFSGSLFIISWLFLLNVWVQ